MKQNRIRRVSLHESSRTIIKSSVLLIFENDYRRKIYNEHSHGYYSDIETIQLLELVILRPRSQGMLATWIWA
jgi:hypothetical protein